MQYLRHLLLLQLFLGKRSSSNRREHLELSLEDLIVNAVKVKLGRLQTNAQGQFVSLFLPTRVRACVSNNTKSTVADLLGTST